MRDSINISIYLDGDGRGMSLKHYEQAATFKAPELLIKKFCGEHGVSETDAKERFEETKKFLILCAANRNNAYSPSNQIDLMWHQFILHTRDYFAFCDRLGTFVHHQPSESRQHDGYELTRRDLKRTFKTLNEKYWGEKSADCDSSSCDCCP